MAIDPLERIIRHAEGPIAPRAEFGDALRKRLLAELEDKRNPKATDTKEDPMTTVIAIPASASSRPAARPEWWREERQAGRKRRSWALTHAATAALLLLTIVSGFFAFDGPRHAGLVGQSSPGVTDELIARAEIRAMRRDYVIPYTGIGRFTLDPGESLTSGPGSTYGDGLYLFVIESGTVNVTTDGSAEVVLSEDATPTPVASGTDVTLHAGDRGAIQPGTATVWRNIGTVSAIVLNASIGETVDVTSEVEATDLYKSHSIAWPEWPAVFALHRLTFEPGASMPVSDLPGLLILAVDRGSLDVPLQTRTRDFDAGEGLAGYEWKIAPDGEFRNAVSEPTVVYAFLVEAVEASPSPSF